MDALAVLGLFLLGAAVGALLTRIQLVDLHRRELERCISELCSRRHDAGYLTYER
jgi:hypothetical protein